MRNDMKQLSKSKYAKYCQCPKCLWMSVYKPEEEVIDPNSEARFENGAEVGELARGILGDYVDVTIRKADDRRGKRAAGRGEGAINSYRFLILSLT